MFINRVANNLVHPPIQWSSYVALQSNDEDLCILLWNDLQNIVLSEKRKAQKSMFNMLIFSKWKMEDSTKLKPNDHVLKEMVREEQG